MRLFFAFLLLVFSFPALAQEKAGESVYDRVLRTGVIRCGYISWNPYLTKDPNTGKMSGLSYEYMEMLAREMNLEVEWTEEVGWGNFQEGLNTDRYDMMCVGVWQSGQRAKVSLLSNVIYYDSLLAFAREDDQRFEAELNALDNPGVTIAVVDGDITQSVKAMKFPKAQTLALPQATDPAQFVLSVATKKADVLLGSVGAIQQYNKNTGPEGVRLKQVGDKPVRYFGSVYAVKSGEFAFKALLDSVIQTVNDSGEAAQIVSRYKSSGINSIAPGYRD